MAYGNLTAARLREVLSYNPQTGEFHWLIATARRVKVGDLAGSKRPDEYFHIGIDGTRYLAHRLAVLYMTGEWPADEVDHKNRSRSDTTWDNLRPATHAQNCKNMPAQKNNRCGIRGVHFRAERGCWVARIFLNGKVIFRENHPTFELAVAARLEGERLHFTPACAPLFSCLDPDAAHETAEPAPES